MFNAYAAEALMSIEEKEAPIANTSSSSTSCDTRSSQKKLVNGFKTCAPLLAAAITSSEENVNSLLKELLKKTATISTEVITLLAQSLEIGEVEKRVIRGLVIKVIHDAVVNERTELLSPESVSSLLAISLTDPDICSEVIIEHELLLSENIILIEVVLQLGELLVNEHTDSSSSAKSIMHHATVILQTMDKTFQRLATNESEQQEIITIRRAVLNQAIAIYKSIYKVEHKAFKQALIRGENLNPSQLNEIIQRKFALYLRSLVDAIVLGGNS